MQYGLHGMLTKERPCFASESDNVPHSSNKKKGYPKTSTAMEISGYPEASI